MGSSGPPVLKEVKYQVHQTIRLHQRGRMCLSARAAEWEIPPNACLTRDVYTAAASYENEL